MSARADRSYLSALSWEPPLWKDLTRVPGSRDLAARPVCLNNDTRGNAKAAHNEARLSHQPIGYTRAGAPRRSDWE